MRFTREERMKMLRKYVGVHHKGGEDTRDNRPINMIELGINIYQQKVASHNPQALVTTEFSELFPMALEMEILLNRQITEANLCDSSNTCSLEAMFTGIGVMVVGITTDDSPPNHEGYQFDAGHVFADAVLFPDLILDMNARDWHQQSYIGHEFTVPVDWIAENPAFDKDVRNRFTHAEMWRQHSDQDWNRVNQREFEVGAKLRQTFLSRQQLLLITAPDHNLQQPLQVIEWQGPKCGPYRPLQFGKVPGHVLPLGVVPLWYDLDDIINKCYAKVADQSLRAKSIGLAMNEDDARTIVDAPDGHVVGVSDPNSVIEKNYGGPNQTVLAVAQLSRQLLSQQAGNLELLGGLSAQSNTLGQDQLLAAGASGRVKEMQQAVIDFQTNIISDMAYWLWTDPVSHYRFVKQVDGVENGIPALWEPGARDGEFTQYNFTVNPYSAIKRSPAEQAEALVQVLTNIMLPTLPYMQQGAPVDWEAFYKLLARYMHLPELKQIIKWPQGESIPEGTPEAPAKPPTSTRRYIRENRSQASFEGKQANLINTLLGGRNQDSETANMLQPTM